MKNYIYLIVALLLFIITGEQLLADEEKILDEKNSVQVKAIQKTDHISDIFYSNKNFEKKIISLPNNIIKNIILTPSGKRMVYTSEISDQLYIYDFEKEATYNISPYGTNSEEIQSHEGSLYIYTNFLLDPTENYLYIEVPWLIRSQEFLIYDLNKIDLILKNIENDTDIRNTIRSSEIAPTPDDIDKLYNFKNKLTDSHTTMYEFQWLKDGNYTFLANKGKDINKINQEKDSFIQPLFEGNVKTGKVRQIGFYPPSPFRDLTIEDPDFETILKAVQAGWLTGYPDGTVRLDQAINRAEYVKIMIQAFDNSEAHKRAPELIPAIFEITPPPEVKMICPDAPADEWYSPSFYAAKQIKAIEGYPNEDKPKDQWLCKPGESINKVEALKVLLSLLELKGEKEDSQFTDTLSNEWYSPFTAYAKKWNLIRTSSDQLKPAKPLTRREMIYMAIRIQEVQAELAKGG